MNQIYIAPLTKVVKRIMILTVFVWLFVEIILDRMLGLNISTWFILHPNQVIQNFRVWQLVTYIFFHALSPFHIFFNGLMLWFFGSELEKHWGSRFFTTYYLTCGVGAALIYCIGVTLYALATGNQEPLIIPVLGASGALFGLLVAYGMIFSERVVYFMGIFPMKAKYFAMLAAALDFSSLLTSGLSGSEVAYLAHIGGALVGFVFLWSHMRLKLNKTRSRLKKKSTPLRLVVDNEKLKDEKNSGPKYWN